jgi:hypothetical protein
MKDKIFFWLDAGFLMYILSYHLQKKIDADFYAIYDLPNKTRTFFQNQKLVNFKKVWYYNDQINFKKNEIDMEYLSNFEKKYDIGLWNLAVNERLFYRFNRFHKFSTEEIWLILEQECKFFENVLDEIKPDFFITREPFLHQDELFYQMCRAKGIKVLVSSAAKAANKCIISEHPAELDDSSISDSEISTTFTSFSELTKNIVHQSNISRLDYNKNMKTYNKKWATSNRERVSAAIEFLFNSNNKNAKTHFAYFGRSKSAVLLDSIKQVLQKRSRSSFINKNLLTSIDYSEKFIYFALEVDQEHNLLLLAPYYTNQIETIRHVAKSIPINYKLYVKEHPSSETRNWRSVSDYKEIMNIPNVRLLHHSVSQDELLQNCSLVVGAAGSSCLEAAFYSKPSVIFGQVYYSILPSVHHVETLSKLPEIISSSLQETVNLQDVERFLTIFKKNSFDFDVQAYYLKEANTFFYNGHLVDVKITESQMKSFIEENAQMFSVLVDEYMKKLKTSLLSK